MSIDWLGLVVGAISIGTILLFGTIGETITQKAGNLNLGIPGIMCLGMSGGCFGVILYMKELFDPTAANYWLVLVIAVLGACILAGFGGLVYAVLTVTLRANQNVVGLSLTIFGAGGSQFVMNRLQEILTPTRMGTLLSQASKQLSKGLSIEKLGWFGEIFLSHSLLVYVAVFLAIVVAIVLKKTKTGLKLRAVGENPATADAVGINVSKYKYGAIILGSSIAGIGGVFYVLVNNGGTFDNTATLEGFGWLAIALVIFTVWKTDLAVLGSFLFGALYILGYKITGLQSLAQKELIKLLPYIVTIIVLIITSIVGKKEAQPPASLGTNYFREDR